MVSVVGYQMIVRPEGADRTDSDRLLTDVQMKKPADASQRILFGRRFLKASNQYHQTVHLEEFRLRIRCKSPRVNV
jgi:hypothetical protein